MLLHVVLRHSVQPRRQRRSKPWEESDATPHVPLLHRYREYFARSLKQLKPPVVINGMY